MHPLIWPVLLLLLAVGLIILEMFIPSGGALSFLSLVAILASVVLAFVSNDPVVGTIFLAVTVVLIPAVIALAIRWWPHTPIGRMMMIQPPGDSDQTDDGRSELLKQLVGKRGRAKSVMLPAGIILVEGSAYDAVSEGMPIDAGQAVQVTCVEGNRITVKPSDPEAVHEQDDVLDRPIDSLGLDPFEDPLA